MACSICRKDGHNKRSCGEFMIENNNTENSEMKVCSKCGIEKSLELFQNNTSGPAQFDSNGNRYKRPECKDCSAAAGKDRAKAKKLAKEVSTPPVGTGCDICNRPGTARFPALRFDHCHRTLAHRGWLCDPCNRSLGVLGDNVKSLVKVINYLNKTENYKLIVEENNILTFEKE